MGRKPSLTPGNKTPRTPAPPAARTPAPPTARTRAPPATASKRRTSSSRDKTDEPRTKASRNSATATDDVAPGTSRTTAPPASRTKRKRQASSSGDKKKQPRSKSLRKRPAPPGTGPTAGRRPRDPTGQIHEFMTEKFRHGAVKEGAAIYMHNIIEYLMAEIVEKSSNVATSSINAATSSKMRRGAITAEVVDWAISMDPELDALVNGP